jgi:hypothetical protein
MMMDGNRGVGWIRTARIAVGEESEIVADISGKGNGGEVDALEGDRGG